MTFNQAAMFMSLKENPRACFVGNLQPTLSYCTGVLRSKKILCQKLRKIVMGISALFFAAWASSPTSFSIENQANLLPNHFLCLFPINKNLTCACIVYTCVFWIQIDLFLETQSLQAGNPGKLEMQFQTGSKNLRTRRIEGVSCRPWVGDQCPSLKTSRESKFFLLCLLFYSGLQ